MHKKYANLLGQYSLQKQIKYENEKNNEKIKPLMSKIKIIKDRYDTLKEANNELKFNYNIHNEMLPLLNTYEEKIKNNNKLIQNFRDNIMAIIKSKQSPLNNDELEKKIQLFLKERDILTNKKLQLNLFLDIYLKGKNEGDNILNKNKTYKELSQPFYRIIGTDPLMNKIKDESEEEPIRN